MTNEEWRVWLMNMAAYVVGTFLGLTLFTIGILVFALVT